MGKYEGQGVPPKKESKDDSVSQLSQHSKESIVQSIKIYFFATEMHGLSMKS